MLNMSSFCFKSIVYVYPQLLIYFVFLFIYVLIFVLICFRTKRTRYLSSTSIYFMYYDMRYILIKFYSYMSKTNLYKFIRFLCKQVPQLLKRNQTENAIEHVNFEAQIQLNVNYSACCNTKSFKHVVDN